MRSIPFVLSDTPRSGEDFVAFSTKPNGVDIIVNNPTVESHWTLGGYVKTTIKGVTDRKQNVRMVLRTQQNNVDEYQFLDLRFYK